MAFASGSQHGLRYIAEETFRTNPGSYAATKSLRNTGASIVLTKDTFVSNEIRSDRQITDLTHGAIRVGGDIPIEFSYGEYDALLAAALGGAWTNNVLKAGKVLTSFQFERAFTDITQYGKFVGCMLNTVSMSIPANAKITGSFGVIGANGSYSADPMYATPAASLTHRTYNSFAGEIEEGGSTIATITSIDWNLSNGMEALFVVGSNLTPEINVGRSNITGTLSAYFEDLSLLEKFINDENSSISIQIGDTENYYEIEFPNISYTGGDNPVNGEGAIVLGMPFQALYDPTAESNIVITRYPSS